MVKPHPQPLLLKEKGLGLHTKKAPLLQERGIG